jgi:hypothetical protein
MAKGFARGRNAPVARSGVHAEVMEGIKPKIERSFESSRLEGELLAVAYETLVPIPRTLRSREPLERLQNMAAAIPAGRETPVLRVQA